jgi:hypothetical protein
MVEVEVRVMEVLDTTTIPAVMVILAIQLVITSV